jgi:Flp pilus assembly protein TadG
MIRRFHSATQGSASVEFALILPMLIVLLFGGLEAGHFVWTQHKLAEAVRDGARFASRLPVEQVCNGATAALSTTDIDRIKLITRTGQLSDANARPVVPGWTAAQVAVEPFCQAFINTGIYSDLGQAGPIIRVRATGVAYPTLFNGLAGLGQGITLTAKSNAAVIGI